MADTTPASTNETRPRIGSIVDGLVVLAIIALCAVCFANSVSGEFVYDDNIQIASNDLIKNPQLLPKAMVSDVFAFKGDTGKAWSNYWRPTFVAWLALNYWLFGLNPVGWHIGNILLHAAVAIAGYATLRAARLPRPLAIAAVFLFAVHPVHVESVAWISGSTDMLFALPLLGSLWMFLATAQRRTALHWCAMLALYAIALLAKESAIVFPAMVFGVSAMIGRREDAGPFQWRAALRDAIPFALMAGLYLLGRYAVLGKFSGESPWKADPVTILNTAPSELAFYLRQTFLPLWIVPSYP